MIRFPSPQTKTGIFLPTISNGRFPNPASGVFKDSDPYLSPASILTGTNTQFDFEYTQPFSVCAWALPNSNWRSTGGHGTVIAGKMNISSDGGATTYRGWFFGTNGNGTTYFSQSFFFALGNTQTNRIVIAASPADWHDGQYNFIVATYDGSGHASGLKLFCNGVQLTTDPTHTVDNLGGLTIRNTAPFAIGSLTMPSTTFSLGGEGYFNYSGLLNQVTIWNTDLSGVSGAITALYNQGIPPNPTKAGPSANLLSYYPLVGTRANPLVTNADTASTIYDAKGTNNLTNTGVALNGHVPFYPAYQNTTSGYFNGTASNVNFGNNLGTNVATSAVAYSMWVNMAALPSPGSYYVLFNKLNIASGHGIILYTTNSTGDRTSFQFQIHDNSGNVIEADGPTGVFTPGQWTHLVVCYDGSGHASGITAFADGQSLTMTVTGAGPLTSSADNSDSFIVGMRTDNTYYYNGLLKDFAIFSQVPSQSTISSIYAAGSPGDLSKFTGLAHWYRFENGSQSQYAATYTDDNSFNIGDRAGFVQGTNNQVTFSSTIPSQTWTPPGPFTWTPSSLPGLTLWMDATDNATITGTTAVTAWKSKSPDATVYTAPAGYEPAVLASGINGKQVMNYIQTGGHGQLFIGPGTAALIDNTNGWYAYVVFKNAAGSQTFLGALTDAGNAAYMQMNSSLENYSKIFFGGPTTDGWQDARMFGASMLDGTSAWEVGFESSAGYNDVSKMTGYVNGTSFPITQTGASTGSGGNRTAIPPCTYSAGAVSIFAGGGYIGYIGEIVVGKTAGGLSTSDRANLHTYLLNKWGV